MTGGATGGAMGGAGGAAGRVDVVVPARDEQARIGACLDALATAARGPLAAGWAVAVVVVCGDSRDATADVARGRAAALAGYASGAASGAPSGTGSGAERVGGLVVDVVETPVAGKNAALDAGDAHRRRCGAPADVVVYLDADVELSPGALLALLAAAAPAAGGPPGAALLLGCRPVVARPRSRVSRVYARTWTALPAVSRDAAGAGCFAVTAAGRARWGGFPPDLPDDAHVRSLFLPAECRVVAAPVLVRFPEARELVGVVARWRTGNRRLRGAGSWGVRARRRDAVLALLRDPPAAAGLPVFLAVNAAARRRGRSGAGTAAGSGAGGWARATT